MPVCSVAYARGENPMIASKRSVRVTFGTGFIPVASWGKALCPLISGALCAPDSRNNRPNQ